MKGKCFIEPLFHKVVSGEKTQFREIIISRTGFFRVESKNRYVTGVWQCDANEWVGDNLIPVKPRYKIGETLYLKEPYRVASDLGDILMDIKLLGRPVPSVEYKYDNTHSGNYWENKLFMPAILARYFIEITGVRCERLQDISDSDCEKEGIRGEERNGLTTYAPLHFYEQKRETGWCRCWNTPQEAYAALIDSIKKGTWESNPFVWVYDFKLTK
jgi:hypothetical protein